MEIQEAKSIIEAILFCVGKEVNIKELVTVLELSEQEVINIIENMRLDYEKENRGMQIIKLNDGYQMCTKKEYYDYIYPIVDKRNKPKLSQAALETLSIIAYNPKVTRAEIESIRGVNSDGTIYKLLDHNLIEEAGKMDAPGRPTMYQTTKEFLRMFGYQNLDELPELPRYKLDENQQIVIEDIMEENNENKVEAPNPEREKIIEENEE